MNADEFVRELRRCAPSMKRLRAQGLSQAEARQMRSRFRATRRRGVGPMVHVDPLDDLVSRFDLSQVIVGYVRFFPELRQGPRLTYFGHCDADVLGRSRSTGEILVEEFPVQGHTLAKCAVSSASFLEALAELARLNARSLVDETFSQDRTNAGLHARRCADLAGGEPYLKFYAELLGADELLGMT